MKKQATFIFCVCLGVILSDNFVFMLPAAAQDRPALESNIDGDNFKEPDCFPRKRCRQVDVSESNTKDVDNVDDDTLPKNDNNEENDDFDDNDSNSNSNYDGDGGNFENLETKVIATSVVDQLIDDLSPVLSSRLTTNETENDKSDKQNNESDNGLGMPKTKRRGFYDTLGKPSNISNSDADTEENDEISDINDEDDGDDDEGDTGDKKDEDDDIDNDDERDTNETGDEDDDDETDDSEDEDDDKEENSDDDNDSDEEKDTNTIHVRVDNDTLHEEMPNKSDCKQDCPSNRTNETCVEMCRINETKSCSDTGKNNDTSTVKPCQTSQTTKKDNVSIIVEVVNKPSCKNQTDCGNCTNLKINETVCKNQITKATTTPCSSTTPLSTTMKIKTTVHRTTTTKNTPTTRHTTTAKTTSRATTTCTTTKTTVAPCKSTESPCHMTLTKEHTTPNALMQKIADAKNRKMGITRKPTTEANKTKGKETILKRVKRIRDEIKESRRQNRRRKRLVDFAYEEKENNFNSGYLPWSDWEPCTVTCGIGHQMRNRKCINSSHCRSGDVEFKLCERKSCLDDIY